MTVLYNGIQLPEAWPPDNIDLDAWQPVPVPWLDVLPEVIPVDLGRQLLVDDFLIQSTNMVRVFHQPAKYPCNPVLFAQGPEERSSIYPHAALAKCGGAWYDDQDKLFKMWYMTGYVGHMALAVSEDGLHWQRPELDVVPGTNLCLPRHLQPDSGTVYLDRDCRDPQARFKMLLREPNNLAMLRAGADKGNAPGLLLTSEDGIHWLERGTTGRMGDRSTMFYNPFRQKWVQSIRGSCARGRCRRYWEHSDFLQSGKWQTGQPLPWASADAFDQADQSPPQLYNLDAVAYESLMLGMFQILKGPPNEFGEQRAEPKLTELVLAYSRDGFYWHRPDRRAFIGANRVPGDWEFGYVEPTGGICLIVGDELWFYYSAYGGQPERGKEQGLRNGMYGHGAVGLAKLRRDGFASLEPRHAGGQLLTRPIRFSGNRLFVNVNTAGAALRAAVLDLEGQPLTGLSADMCIPYVGNNTCAELRWQDPAALDAVRDRPVRLRLSLDRGALFSFWITGSGRGASGGYLAAGGPGLPGSRDCD
jgi:hypothetical protein